MIRLITLVPSLIRLAWLFVPLVLLLIRPSLGIVTAGAIAAVTLSWLPDRFRYGTFIGGLIAAAGFEAFAAIRGGNVAVILGLAAVAGAILLVMASRRGHELRIPRPGVSLFAGKAADRTVEGRDPERPGLPPAVPTRDPVEEDRRGYGDLDPVKRLSAWVGPARPVLIGQAPWPGLTAPAALGPVAMSSGVTTVVIGLAGSGKTRSIIVPSVTQWAGPAICTSNKPDLMYDTVAARTKRGPVFVVDIAGELTPADLPPKAQLVRWHPALASTATDWDVARETALILASDVLADAGKNKSFADTAAKAVVAPLIHAAALKGHGMRWVLDRLADLDEDGPVICGWLNDEFGSDRAATALRGALNGGKEARAGFYGFAGNILDAYQSRRVLDRCENEDLPLLNPDDIVASPNATLYLVATREATSSAGTALFDLLIRRRFDLVDQGRLKKTDETTLLLAVDEFAESVALSKARIKQVISAARARRIQPLFAFQEMNQLRDKFGDKFAESFVGQAKCLVQVGETNDEWLADRFASKGGEAIVDRRHRTRKLVDVDVSHERKAEERLTVADVLRGVDGYHCVRYGGHVRWVKSFLEPGDPNAERALDEPVASAVAAAAWYPDRTTPSNIKKPA